VGIRMSSGKMPSNVSITGNIAINNNTTQSSVFLSCVIVPHSLTESNNIIVQGNICKGFNVGVSVYFDGDVQKNFNGISVLSNDFIGLTSPAGFLPNAAVYLYGPSEGRVNPLVISGNAGENSLKVATNISSRARVYGNCTIPSLITFQSLTIGNGSTASFVSLNTDSGTAFVTGSIVWGSTTAATGNILVRFDGIVVTSSTVGAALIGGVPATALAQRAASWLTTFDSTGAIFGLGNTMASGDTFTASATVPCDYADI